MIEEICSDLFRIQIPLPNSPLKFLNSYVFRSPQRHLIVDTGLNRRECLEAMQSGLKELDVDLAKTDFFITHLHADHFGLVSKLITDTSRIYFNRPDAEKIEAGDWVGPMTEYAARHGFPEGVLQRAIAQHPGNKYSSEWVPELNLLKDGDVIDVGSFHLVCVSTPGHSLGHMCLYEPEKKIFVAGDHILIDITPNIQCWADGQNPLGNYLDSLDRVYELDIDLVLPGHRRLVHDHKERIDQLKKHHMVRLNEVVDILQEGAKNAYETASLMTWDIRSDSWEDFPVAQKWFATGEAIAHLRYLEEAGRISRVAQGDQVTYALNGT